MELYSNKVITTSRAQSYLKSATITGKRVVVSPSYFEAFYTVAALVWGSHTLGEHTLIS